MRSIFVGSTGASPGQSLATWALASLLKDRGLRVGFFKPYGLLPDRGNSLAGGACDSDVLFFREVLGLSDPPEVICPVMLTESPAPEVVGGSKEQTRAKIEDAFRKASQGKDLLLIMGAKEIFLGDVSSQISDSTLVQWFNASVLLVDRYQRDNMTLYSLLSLNSFLNGRVKSAVINHVPPEKMDHVRTKVIPFLKEKGLPAVAAIPENPVLSSWTVSTVAELISGRVLCCPEYGDSLIASFTIGARQLEGPLSVFKQVYNKIILCGLETEGKEGRPVVGVILTGGKIPGDMVLRIAREGAFPLILTSTDTFQTMERLENARPVLTARDGFKLRQFLQFIDRELGAGNWADSLL